jgi:hypothetical protein
MCTLSWARDSSGVDIFFNRDEQRSRPEALPPKRDPSGVLAPLDPPGGGTWIFANPSSFCGALLNAYDHPSPPEPRDGFRSRGLLMRDLAPTATSHNAETLLREALDLAPYPPFLFAGLTLHDARAWRWDGRELTALPLPLPLITTSSHKPQEIIPLRLQYYQSITATPVYPSPEELERFHNWHDPENPEVSAVMSRTDARTVSFTRVSLREGLPPRMSYTERLKS